MGDVVREQRLPGTEPGPGRSAGEIRRLASRIRALDGTRGTLMDIEEPRPWRIEDRIADLDREIADEASSLADLVLADSSTPDPARRAAGFAAINRARALIAAGPPAPTVELTDTAHGAELVVDGLAVRVEWIDGHASVLVDTGRLTAAHRDAQGAPFLTVEINDVSTAQGDGRPA